MSTKYVLTAQPEVGTHVWTMNGSYFSILNKDGWQRWFHCDCTPEAIPAFHVPVNTDGMTWGELLFAVETAETFVPGERVRPATGTAGETVNLLEALRRANERADEAEDRVKVYQAYRSMITSFVTRLNEKAPEMTDETLRHNIRVLLNLIEKG